MTRLQKLVNFLGTSLIDCLDGSFSLTLSFYNLPSGKLTWQWKMDPDWRCISYWKWWYSIAMLVYQRVPGMEPQLTLGLCRKDSNDSETIWFWRVLRHGFQICVSIVSPMQSLPKFQCLERFPIQNLSNSISYFYSSMFVCIENWNKTSFSQWKRSFELNKKQILQIFTLQN